MSRPTSERTSKTTCRCGREESKVVWYNNSNRSHCFIGLEKDTQNINGWRNLNYGKILFYRINAINIKTHIEYIDSEFQMDLLCSDNNGTRQALIECKAIKFGNGSSLLFERRHNDVLITLYLLKLTINQFLGTSFFRSFVFWCLHHFADRTLRNASYCISGIIMAGNILLTYSKMCNQFTEQQKRCERQQTALWITQLLSVSIVQTNKQTHTLVHRYWRRRKNEHKEQNSEKDKWSRSKLLLPRRNTSACLARLDLVIIILILLKRNKIRILYRFRFWFSFGARFFEPRN